MLGCALLRVWFLNMFHAVLNIELAIEDYEYAIGHVTLPENVLALVIDLALRVLDNLLYLRHCERLEIWNGFDHLDLIPFLVLFDSAHDF